MKDGDSMVCYCCPYRAIVRDEHDGLHDVCAFSKSERFLTGAETGDGCTLDADIRKSVYEDDNYHGACYECVHSGDESVCARCVFGDGESDLWKWDGDES